MSMTKKHYEMVAKVFAKTRLYVEYEEHRNGRESARQYLAEELADQFASDNPLFDRARFLKACGVQA